ncbi:MAG: ferrous iron transport protein B [Desulfurispora sp.]|uniref:ferrous iron transport protein B n=1 Tax=Desulfurispora sp. TaxID=3014275 RepID=UPI004049F991
MAHCHASSSPLKDYPDVREKVVLAGNPNTGKSVLFHHFTGMYVDVSNYPGTTLEISSGKVGSILYMDTPGVYGISSFNDEEMVARDIILGADKIVNVVSATHLERDLFLTQQIIDTGLPLIVALNMVDEAERLGMIIDVQKLSRQLGVPVVPTVAVNKKGFSELIAALPAARSGQVLPLVEQLVKKYAGEGEYSHIRREDLLLILEGDPEISSRYGVEPLSFREEIYVARREYVNKICQQVISEPERGLTVGKVISRLMLRPLTGIPLLLMCLWLMYQIVGVFIAGDVVGFTEETIMQGYYEPWIRQLVSYAVPLNSFPGRFLTGEFGLLTMTVTYLLGLLLPLVVGFYLVLSVFEDSGYLPRIATLVDRLLNSIGLNGRGVIPIILGFGCVTMATITTRLLSTEREKRIAIFLLGLTIPCSAQLGVIAGMLATVGGTYLMLYCISIFMVMAVAGTLLSRLLPGQPSYLLIDLPPLRWPRIGNVLRKTFLKTTGFLREAAPLFALGAALISVMQETGLLQAIQNLLAPLTVSWLGLPKEAATAFVMGVVRRDFGAAGLTALHLSSLQTVVALVTITLFVPCIASIMVIFKERSKKEATWIWGASVCIAFFTGGLIKKMSKIIASVTGAVMPGYTAALLVTGGLVLIIAARWFAAGRDRAGTAHQCR